MKRDVPMLLTKGLEQPKLFAGFPVSPPLPGFPAAWKVQEEKGMKKYPWGIG